jgi:DNA-binding CsgD family transcriptional regulator
MLLWPSRNGYLRFVFGEGSDLTMKDIAEIKFDGVSEAAQSLVHSDTGWGQVTSLAVDPLLGGWLRSRAIIPSRTPDGLIAMVGVAFPELARVSDDEITNLLEVTAELVRSLAREQSLNAELRGMRALAVDSHKKLLLCTGEGQTLFGTSSLISSLPTLFGKSFANLSSIEGAMLPASVVRTLDANAATLWSGKTGKALVKPLVSDFWALGCLLFLLEFTMESAEQKKADGLDYSLLSKTELAVVRLAQQGYTNRQIATIRGVAFATVQNQLHAAYEKTGLRGRRDLMRAETTLPVSPNLTAVQMPDTIPLRQSKAAPAE